MAEFLAGQSDVNVASPMFWLTMTLLLNAAVLVIIVGVLTGDISSVGKFLEDCVNLARKAYIGVLEWLGGLLGKLI
jgi:hypothetical protein